MFVAPHDRFVQRRKARFHRIGIGAVREQQVHDVVKAGMSRQRERAHAPGVLVVCVRARHQEVRRRVHVADARRKQQRGLVAGGNLLVVRQVSVRRHGHDLTPLCRAQRDVGAVGDQDSDDVWMLLRHCPHQRGLASGTARVDVGALVQQRSDDVRLAGLCGDHQRGLTGKQRQIGFGPGGEQTRDHLVAAVLRGKPERRDAEVGGGIHVRARANQRVRLHQVVLIARAMQRRRPVAVGSHAGRRQRKHEAPNHQNAR